MKEAKSHSFNDFSIPAVYIFIVPINWRLLVKQYCVRCLGPTFKMNSLTDKLLQRNSLVKKIKKHIHFSPVFSD